MKTTHKQNLLTAVLVWVVALATSVAQASDALPSWNDGKAKQSIYSACALVCCSSNVA